MIRLRFALFALLAGFAPLQSAFADEDPDTGREVYEIPGHGELIMDVPKGWQATFYQPENDSYPIISFFPFKGPKIFQLSVAVFWSDRALKNLNNPDNLRDFVDSVGQSVLEQSDQDSFTLEKIQGNSGIGYLFDLTDKQAGEGEYTHLTQGAISVGNIIVAFSLLTRDEQREVLRQRVLTMLKNARQDLSRRDVRFELPTRIHH